MRVLTGVVIAGLGGWLAVGCAATTGGERAEVEKRQEGPVCMCSTGLSEADIQAAQQQRDQEEP